MTKLSLFERAHLQVATRQFGPALDTYEKAFFDERIPPVKLTPALSQYLVTSVRVRRDAARPLPVLKSYSLVDFRADRSSLVHDIVASAILGQGSATSTSRSIYSTDKRSSLWTGACAG